MRWEGQAEGRYAPAVTHTSCKRVAHASQERYKKSKAMGNLCWDVVVQSRQDSASMSWGRRSLGEGEPRWTEPPTHCGPFAALSIPHCQQQQGRREAEM